MEEPSKGTPLCVPLSLHGLANICLPNIFFSISMSIAFLPLEVSNDCPQILFFSLAEIVFKDFSHFGTLLSFPGSLPCIHVIKLLFDFFLVNLSHASLILNQPEGPTRVEEYFFLPDTHIYHYAPMPSLVLRTQ